MIKVGIIGAESNEAGELLRLLVHHPEVELTTVYAPALRGRMINSYHRGLVGDTEMKFADTVDFEDLDVVFITSDNYSINQQTELPDSLKVISMESESNRTLRQPFDRIEYVPGVSEMYRKPLVRGARGARILSSAASVAIIALYPLALHLLLNDSLSIKVKVPLLRDSHISSDELGEEITRQLQKAQLSFSKVQATEIESHDKLRALIADIEFDCAVSEEEIERVYNEIYDDHNFTFLVRTEPLPTEVAGTHKCLLYISKPSEGRLHIKAVADSVLRGGAGDAIHAMNLLFGLFEKTGLSLPAGLAFNNDKE